MRKSQLLLACVAGLLAFGAYAKGPAPKTTGDVTLNEDKGNYGACTEGGQFRQIDFNAHAPMDPRPAKGTFSETLRCQSDGFVRRYFEADVLAVCVQDDTAYFLIQFVVDTVYNRDGTSSPGGLARTDLMKVVDMGEPAYMDSIARAPGVSISAADVNTCNILNISPEALPKAVDSSSPGSIAEGNIQVHKIN